MATTFNRRRGVVFLLTFLSYALYHASRKNLSGVKASITAEWLDRGTAEHPRKPLFNNAAEAQTFLGSLDALFMICYAVALVYWGWLGDRLNPRNVVVFGMFGSAVTVGFCLHFTLWLLHVFHSVFLFFLFDPLTTIVWYAKMNSLLTCATFCELHKEINRTV